MKTTLIIFVLFFSSSVFAVSTKNFYGNCEVIYYEFSPKDRIQNEDDIKFIKENIYEVYHNGWFHIDLNNEILVDASPIFNDLNLNIPIYIDDYEIIWKLVDDDRQKEMITLERITGILSSKITLKYDNNSRIDIKWKCDVSEKKLL